MLMLRLEETTVAIGHVLEVGMVSGLMRVDYVYGPIHCPLFWKDPLLQQSSYTAMSLSASQLYFYGCRAFGHTSEYYDVSIAHRWQVCIRFHSHAKLLNFLEP